jgi:hypothetical protein
MIKLRRLVGDIACMRVIKNECETLVETTERTKPFARYGHNIKMDLK